MYLHVSTLTYKLCHHLQFTWQIVLQFRYYNSFQQCKLLGNLWTAPLVEFYLAPFSSLSRAYLLTTQSPTYLSLWPLNSRLCWASLFKFKIHRCLLTLPTTQRWIFLLLCPKSRGNKLWTLGILGQNLWWLHHKSLP